MRFVPGAARQAPFLLFAAPARWAACPVHVRRRLATAARPGILLVARVKRGLRTPPIGATFA
jgi:hypothetical protein